MRLRNPMSEEQAVMRTHVVGSLLDAAERNVRRGAGELRLFEIGGVYLPWDAARPRPPGRWDPPPGTPGAAAWRDGTLPDERMHVCALLTGRMRPPSWREADPPRADFFAVKGVLEAVGAALRVPLAFEPASEPFLHPVRAARVLVEGVPAGWIGELHPRVVERWDLEAASAFEVDVAILAAHAVTVPAYRDLTSFPALRLDLALVAPAELPAEAVLAVARREGAPLLESAGVFDVYEGAQVGEGRRSLAIRLAFRAADRTLTDEEVAGPRERILAALRELGVELRA